MNQPGPDPSHPWIPTFLWLAATSAWLSCGKASSSRGSLGTVLGIFPAESDECGEPLFGNHSQKNPKSQSTMKTPYGNLLISKPLASLTAAAACLLLGSCASTTVTPPPPGFAIIDAKPDPDRRKHIEWIELVSINGKSVKGTRCVIEPGLNTIKTRFRWPQGQDQQLQLRFYATPGTIYFIYYNVYPPSTELTDSVAGRIVDSLGEGDAYGAVWGTVILGPPAAVIGMGERISHGVTQHRKPAQHIDLMVVARHSSQGIVQQVRVYPDGRVDEKPWAASTQMKAP